MWAGRCRLPLQLTTVHVLMRDEKEERKKQARSNKNKQGKATAFRALSFLDPVDSTDSMSNYYRALHTPCKLVNMIVDHLRIIWTLIKLYKHVTLKIQRDTS